MSPRYRGHRVLQTLVRAYFSPVESTGQRYIYTGSTDGTVYIYDVVSGETVKKLSGHFATVRDVSWHPSLPIIATSSVRFLEKSLPEPLGGLYIARVVLTVLLSLKRPRLFEIFLKTLTCQYLQRFTVLRYILSRIAGCCLGVNQISLEALLVCPLRGRPTAK